MKKALSTRISIFLLVDAHNASTSKSIIFFTGGDAPANEKFRLNSSGFVMTAKVASDILPATSNTYGLGSSSYRWKTVYSNNILNVSDARLKKNIADLNYGLSAVLKMRPVQYDWKDNSEKVKRLVSWHRNWHTSYRKQLQEMNVKKPWR